MNIVHVINTTSGGAGIATLRLHLALRKQNVNSKILCLKNKTNDNKTIEKVEPITFNILKRFINKFIPIITESKNKRVLNGLNGEYEIFTFPETDYRISRHPLIEQADIINLHWIGDFLNYATFFKNCKKPIVWTLHDMNPFKGGFHYNFDELNNNQFKEVNDVILNKKHKNYKTSSINTIVSPSKWLLNESKNSKLLGEYNHHHICNGADSEVFNFQDKNEARQKLNLPLNKTIFLFVSQDLSCYRKGFDIIENLIDFIDDQEVLFIAAGNEPEKSNNKITYLGSITDENEMAVVYNAASAFLLPSREDNLPNTMVEALLCGTPVIGNSIGGIKETIINGINGFLVDDKNFRDCVTKFMNNTSLFNERNISLDAQNRYSEIELSKNYLELYKSILNE